MANAIKGGSGSGPTKAKYALIHRVPVWNTQTASRAGGVRITWRPLTQWVKVGSPKWNRIMAAAAKTNVHIVPTKYTRSTSRPPAPSAAPGTTVTDRLPTKAPNGNPIAGQGKGAAPGGIGSGSVKPTRTKAKPPTTTQHNSAATLKYIGKPNVGTMLPRSMAAKIAQLQFGGQIADTQNQIRNQTAQSAQDLADIKNWYGAVNTANQGAAQAATGAANQGAQSDQATTAALLHAIGGGANAGAGQVAASGDAASALQRALGTIAQQGAAQAGAAYANASAGASAAQNALNNQAMNALQTQLTSLQGQQGDAQAQALMQIIQANNATLQQRFSNRLASLSAAESAAMLPGQLKLQGAQIGQARAATQQAKQAAQGFKPWATLDAATQQSLARSWMINPDGQTLATPQVALSRARAQGYTAPAVVNYVQSLYR